jgi:hypothetical protein
MAFWNCSDPFVNALKSAGYNMVRLPKADIQPMQLLYKNGDALERLGAVTKLLVEGGNIQVPAMTTGTRAANISGTRTSEMKIGFGLSLLGTIIGAMGGATIGLETEYSRAKTAAFEFNDVLEDRIEVLDLDQYLGDADINPASVYVGKLLEADKLFITTAIIKSTKFTFEAKDASGNKIDLNVPAIQGIVSGKVKVGVESAASTKLTYEGETPLVFGFQAVQIFYENGAYTSFKPASDVTHKSLDNPWTASKKAEPFVSQDTFVRLGEIA